MKTWLYLSAYIFVIELIKYLFFCPGGFFIIWKFFPKWAKSRSIQNKKYIRLDLIRDLNYSILFFFIISFVNAIPFISKHKLYSDSSLYGGRAWIILSFLLLVFIHDAYFFWTHYLLHKNKFLNRIHQVHHKTTNPCFLSTHSFHPIEAIIQGIWVVPVLMLIPLHTTVLLTFGFFALFLSMAGHSGFHLVPSKLRKVKALKWLNFPEYHNIHHSKGQYNLGLYFRYWDLLMKTNKDFDEL